MMLELFGWTAIAVTWPLALIAPWSIGLGPIGAQTAPFRLIQALSGPDEPDPQAALHPKPHRRPPDPLTASRRRPAIDTIARGRARKARASAADLPRTGVSRSRGAPRGRRTARARVRTRDVVPARGRPGPGRPRPHPWGRRVVL